MLTQPKNSQPDSQQAIDHQYWINHHVHLLENQIQWATTYIRRHSSDELGPRFDTFIGLLNAARNFRTLHLPAAKLISTLHPWPQHWGRWQVWETELRFAAETYAHNQQAQLHAQSLGYLISPLMRNAKLDEALTVGKQALAMAYAQCDPTLFPDMTFDLIETLKAGKQPAQVHSAYEKAATQFRQLRACAPRQDWKIADARFKVRSMWERLGPYRGAADEYISTELSDLLAGLEQVTDLNDVWLDLYHYASLLYRRGRDFDRAVHFLKRKIQLSLAMGNQFAEEHDAGNMALIYWQTYQFEKAANSFKRRVAWCEQSNDRWFLVRSVGHLGNVYLSQGQLELARQTCQYHLSLAKQIGDQRLVGDARINLANIDMCLGNYPAAIEELESWLSLAKPAALQAAIELLNLSRCYAAIGQKQQASQRFEQAWQLVQTNDLGFVYALAVRHLADYKPASERLEYLQQALKLFRENGRRLSEAECLFALAHASVDASERTKLWELGVAILTEIKATAWLQGATIEQPPLIPATWL